MTANGILSIRKDFKIKNNRNLTLVVSLYQTHDEQLNKKPCVIGLHCNGGCRIE
jgi:hypothetical protein